MHDDGMVTDVGAAWLQLLIAAGQVAGAAWGVAVTNAHNGHGDGVQPAGNKVCRGVMLQLYTHCGDTPTYLKSHARVTMAPCARSPESMMNNVGSRQTAPAGCWGGARGGAASASGGALANTSCENHCAVMAASVTGRPTAPRSSATSSPPPSSCKQLCNVGTMLNWSQHQDRAMRSTYTCIDRPTPLSCQEHRQ